jgi:superfamily II DNA or RNA helicase
VTTLHLRDYQQDCIDAVFNAWREGVRRPAAVLPTGAGKTVVFSHLIKQFRDEGAETPHRIGDGYRVIVLVHRDELADQAIDKIRHVAPDLNVGKVKAESNDITADVMVCSVQTLASQLRRASILLSEKTHGGVGLIITDECHHGAAPTYKKIYAAFPDALNLGVTATLQRGDGVGLGSVWDEVVYTRSILWMISKGFLSDVRGKSIDVGDLDLGGVKKSLGDFQIGDLGRALEDSAMVEQLPVAYREHAGSRPGIIFTPTVSTAEQTAKAFNAAGIPTEMVSGETPREERLGIFERFRTGQTQVLANCMVLTEGFDAPWASCAVIARPTTSAALYTQMVGRVLRPYPGKTDALVLNVAGPGQRLCSLIDLDPGEVRDMVDGESLAEAVVREAEAPARGSMAFDLKFKDEEMFSASKTAWLSTRKGVLFIPCGTTSVFLWPAETPGLWDVGAWVRGNKPEKTPHVGLDLSSAMAWAEAVAEDQQEFSVQRGARWRKSPPSDGQVAMADRLGLDVTGMRRGQVSEAIDVLLMSDQFDQYL